MKYKITHLKFMMTGVKAGIYWTEKTKGYEEEI
jgi:hypothetical protein